MNRTQALATVLARGQHDPEYFVDNVYSWGVEGTPLENFAGPREWQREVLIEVGEHLRSARRYEPLKIAVASGHGIGKSALMAFLTQWGITTMTDAMGVITANTEGQLRTKTWPEMRTWLSRSMLEPEFKLDGTVFRSSDPKHHLTWRMDAIPWSESNPEAFQGLHNMGKRIILLYDEASAIADKIWEVSEGAMTDANTEIIWVAFGNPTRPVGRFYRAFRADGHRWHHRQIDSRTVPGTNKKQLNDWVEDYGEDSDFVRVRVRGQFPNAAANQLIELNPINLAMSLDGEIAPRITSPLIMGIDVSREGGDETVMMFRKGRVAGVHGVHKFQKLRTPTLADQAAKLILEHHPHYVNIDGGGVGGPLCDTLLDRGFMVTEVPFGAAVEDKDYANKRAQMWCRMRDWIHGGDVSLPWNEPELLQQLIQQTYHYRDNLVNDLILTSKKVMKSDGLRSPDIADALALTFAEEVAAVVDPKQGNVTNADVARTEYDTAWS